MTSLGIRANCTTIVDWHCFFRIQMGEKTFESGWNSDISLAGTPYVFPKNVCTLLTE
jgi:hypothetical protein